MTGPRRLRLRRGRHPRLDQRNRRQRCDVALARLLGVSVEKASALTRRLAALGIDTNAVVVTVERKGVAAFRAWFDAVLLLEAQRHTPVAG